MYKVIRIRDNKEVYIGQTMQDCWDWIKAFSRDEQFNVISM